MLYGVDAIQDIQRDMVEIMSRSAQVDLAVWRKRRWSRRLLEKLLRVFSIWM